VVALIVSLRFTSVALDQINKLQLLVSRVPTVQTCAITARLASWSWRLAGEGYSDSHSCLIHAHHWISWKAPPNSMICPARLREDGKRDQTAMIDKFSRQKKNTQLRVRQSSNTNVDLYRDLQMKKSNKNKTHRLDKMSFYQSVSSGAPCIKRNLPNFHISPVIAH